LVRNHRGRGDARRLQDQSGFEMNVPEGQGAEGAKNSAIGGTKSGLDAAGLAQASRDKTCQIRRQNPICPAILL
jgi:hypothetical protein